MVAEYLRTVALEVNNRTKGAHVWRSYQGGSNAWWERQPIFRHLSRITAANGANAAFSDLEALVTAKGSRGISSAPDWEGIVRDLRKTDEEVAFQQERQATAATHKATKASKRKQPAEAEEAEGVEFYPDGARVEEGAGGR